MLGLFSTDVCPIGIDIGAHALRILQFRRKGDQLVLQAAGQMDFDAVLGATTPSERLLGALKGVLSDHRFVGKKAVLSLPPAALHCKSVRLPQMPDSDLQQALSWEAKDRFGFEIGDGRLVWFRAGEVRRGTEVKDELLLFAVQAETLAMHVDTVAAAGLMIEGIDIAPCASYRSAVRSGSFSMGATVGILEIGLTGSQFVITRHDELIFYKHIDIGGKMINEAIAQKLGITSLEARQMRARLSGGDGGDDESAPLTQALQDAIRPPLEELARELDMCMRYFVVTFRGARPELITLTGQEATCPHVIESLTSTLGLKVEATQPLRGVLDLGDTARPDRSSEWSVAAGLSLYPVNAAKQAANGVAA